MGQPPASAYGTHISVSALQIPNTSGSHVIAGNGAIISCSNMKLGAAGGRHFWADEGGVLLLSGAIEVTGGGVGFITAGSAARVNLSNFTLTISNNPVFTTFATTYSGIIRSRSAAFSGTARGERFSVAAGGVIDTAGGAANFFPGDGAGSIHGGFYS